MIVDMPVTTLFCRIVEVRCLVAMYVTICIAARNDHFYTHSVHRVQCYLRRYCVHHHRTIIRCLLCWVNLDAVTSTTVFINLPGSTRALLARF